MSETLTCDRCRREAPMLDTPPIPGALGDEIRRRICRDCWTEWQGMEVMVINELRLNFMDTRAQQILDQQMREFLALDADETAGAPESDPS